MPMRVSLSERKVASPAEQRRDSTCRGAGRAERQVTPGTSRCRRAAPAQAAADSAAARAGVVALELAPDRLAALRHHRQHRLVRALLLGRRREHDELEPAAVDAQLDGAGRRQPRPPRSRATS